jgi:hypothetical protein
MTNKKTSWVRTPSIELDEEIKTAKLHTDRITLRPPSRKKIDRVLSGNSSPKEKILLYFDSLAYTNITTDREEYLTEEESEYVCSVYLSSKKSVFIKEIAMFFKGFTIFKDSIKSTEHRVELISAYIKESLRETVLIRQVLEDINQIAYNYIPEEKREEALKSIHAKTFYAMYGAKLTKNGSEVYLDVDPNKVRKEVEEAIKQLIGKVEEFKLFKDLFESITDKRLPLPSIRQYIKSCSNKVEETYSEITKGLNLFNRLLLSSGEQPLVLPTYEEIKSEEITPEDIESIKEIGR